ncbi:MAG: transglutaminase domain-containing protein [Micropepsaceae bacterium]
MFKRLLAGVAFAGVMAASGLAADFRVPAPDAAAPSIPAPPPAPDLETLNLVDTVMRDADAAASLPEADWDLDALTATFNGDPAAAYAWVKSNTRFEPYAGVLRGALGTLSARAGNAADRARLLAGLLTRMDVKVRYARGVLDDAQAAALVDSAFVATSIPATAPRSELLDAAALRAARDYAVLRPLLNAEAAAAQDAGLDAAQKAAADHVWVEAEIGGVWTALDVAATQAGETLTAAAETTDDLPETAFQTVTFRVTATAIADGAVSNTVPLEARLPAAKLSGSSIFLAFVENPKEGGLGGAISKTLSGGGTFVPVLYVDGEPFVGEVVPGLGKSGGGALDLLGEPEAGASVELARLELVIETGGPGGVTAMAVRTLLDRAPAAAAIEASTALAPMPLTREQPAAVAAMHNIQVTTGPVNLRNAYALRALAVTETVLTLSDPEKVKDLSPADLIWPLAAVNLTLPTAIENAIMPALNDKSGVKLFTGSPRVSILSTGAVDGPDGSLYRVSEIDLKLSGLTVLARAGEAAAAFDRRLWAGILDAAAETEFGLRSGAQMFVPETTTRVSASMASDAALVRHDGSTGALAADAPRTALAAVAGGALVFAPEGDLAAWWEIDPASGAARAVLAPDLGGQRSYGGYRPEPSRSLDSSWGRQRTGLNSGRGGVVSMSSDGSRSIVHGQRGLGRPPSGGPPPNRCSGGTEYMIILGCVSIPASWSVGFAYGAVVTELIGVATGIIMALP